VALSEKQNAPKDNQRKTESDKP